MGARPRVCVCIFLCVSCVLFGGWFPSQLEENSGKGGDIDQTDDAGLALLESDFTTPTSDGFWFF